MNRLRGVGKVNWELPIKIERQILAKLYEICRKNKNICESGVENKR